MKFPIIDKFTSIVSLLSIFMTLGVSILGFYIKNYIFGIIFLVMWIIAFFGTLYNCFGKIIEISSEGVKFTFLFKSKSYQLRWEDIKTVGVSNLSYNIGSGPRFIYFSIKSEDHYFSVSMKNISEEFIMLRYRKRVINEIRKYWKEDIYNSFL